MTSPHAPKLSVDARRQLRAEQRAERAARRRAAEEEKTRLAQEKEAAEEQAALEEFEKARFRARAPPGRRRPLGILPSNQELTVPETPVLLTKTRAAAHATAAVAETR